MKKYIAEAFGTGILTLGVALSLVAINLPAPTIVLASVIVGALVYALGSISGAHLNPAVTAGVWALGKISRKDAVWYIVAQTIGAFAAMAIQQWLKITPNLPEVSGFNVGAAEFLGTAVLTFVVAGFVYGRISKEASGLAIGGALYVGIALAVMIGSYGALNPAVALGIGVLNVTYLLFPLLGGIFGAVLYGYLQKEGK